MNGDQCPGCGSMVGCDCSPADIRAQLVKDRAELSDRAAAFTARANEAARLFRNALPFIDAAGQLADRPRPGALELAIEIEDWLAP